MKKYSLLTGALIGAASLFMLGSSANAAESGELLRSCAQSLMQIDHAIVTPSLDLGFAITIPSSADASRMTDVPFGVTADGSLSLSRADNISIHADGNAEINLLNMLLPYEGDAYIVPDSENGYLLFAGYDEGAEMNWQVMPFEVPSSLLPKLLGQDAFVLDTFPVDFVTDDEPVTVDGVSCYALRSTLDWSGLKALFLDAVSKAGDGSAALPAIPQAVEALADQAFGSIVIDVELDLREDNYLAQHFSIKANDSSDWSAIGTLFASYLGTSAGDVPVSVTDPKFDIEVSFDYETPVTVDVPDEVVSAVTE